MYMTKSAMAWIFIVKMGGLQWELRMKASKLSTLSSPSYSSSGEGDGELLSESSSGEGEDSGAKSFCEGGLLYE